MTVFDQTKSLVENLNYLSGPVIALLGFVAILQLRTSRKAIITTSKRQAAELASEQVKIYADKIIPLQEKLYRSNMRQKSEKFNLQNLHQFTLEELKQKTSKENINIKIKEYFTTVSDIAEILNHMESFAIYFTKGVADEEIAFSATGSTFCFSVQSFAFELCLIRCDDEINAYDNIIKLYHIWHPKITSEKINRELKLKQQELNNLKISKVDILGTN